MTIDAVMPAEGEQDALLGLSALLLREGDRPSLVLRGRGAEHEVPDSVREVLLRVAEILASGRGLAVVALDQQLTTREAAELLGVSRPTLIKILDAGEIGHSRPTSSRRVPLEEVLAFKERRSLERRALLNEMTADAVEMGFYDRPASAGPPG